MGDETSSLKEQTGGVPEDAVTLKFEKGFVKMTRRPAKMGLDYIFWVPRVYIKNGVVDPKATYFVHLHKNVPGMKETDVQMTIENGFVKFARKPAKMGEDYIFWIPRVYIKNGLVNPSFEYAIYLQKK